MSGLEYTLVAAGWLLVAIMFWLATKGLPAGGGRPAIGGAIIAAVSAAAVAGAVMVATHYARVMPTWTLAEAAWREPIHHAPRTAFFGLLLPSTLLLAVASTASAANTGKARYWALAGLAVLALFFFGYLMILASVSGLRMIG
jgi:hypothetical protein